MLLVAAGGGTGFAQANTGNRVPVTPGQWITAAGLAAGSSGRAGIGIFFYTSAGAYVSEKWSTSAAPAARHVLSSLVPAGAAFAGYAARVYSAAGGNPNAGDSAVFDGFIVALGATQAEAEAGSKSYFDGSTPADDTYTYSWTGAPHVSTSIAEYVPYYVEAEAVIEAGKPPRANITIHSIPGEQVLRLERTSGGETVIVPGARRKRSSGAAVIADPFPALGVPTTYTLWVGTQAMRQATLTVESATGWLQDPIYPDQAVPVVGHSGVAGALKLTSESLQSVTYPVTGTEHKVMGGQYGVVVGSGRGGAEGITLTHSSYDRELDAAVRDLVKETPVLVLRPPAGLQPLPPVSYLHAVFTDMPLTTHWGGNLARFSLAGNLVQAILTAVRSGLATYEDVHAVLSGYTYAEVAAMQSGKSYLDVQKDPTAI